jgi:prophage DNA circulation protein
MSGTLGQITGGLRQATGVVQGVGALARTAGGLVNDVARLGQALGGGGAVDNSALSWADGSWSLQLQPGSWRGVGFVLDAGTTAAGRRVAIHEYPYRDDAWAEDIGKLPRRFAIQAFIVGDDVYQRRDAMLKACEQAGAGTLVHPTLGAIQCVLMEFSCADRRERGRVVEFSFAFIVAGDVLYPSTATATGQNVTAAIEKLKTASAGDLGSFLGGVGEVAKQVTATVVHYTSIASTLVGDASRVFNSVRGLVGFFGRYATGSRSVLQPVTATVRSALGAATAARTLVNTTAGLVNHLASFL